MDTAGELAAELRSLRRGPALGAPVPRVGPVLRALCALGPAAGAEETRTAVRAALTDLMDGLADEERAVLELAFGLDQRAPHRFYGDRIRWAARTHQRDERTVRRHVDRAVGRVSALAAARLTVPPSAPSAAWSTRELRVSVSLDRPGVETFELRRVVADTDGLDELDLAVTVPGGFDDVRFDVFYGGTLRARQRESSARIGYSLALPRPLNRGELHEYAIRTVVPPAVPVLPHLVCVPRYPVALFDLRVRFPQAARPARVRRLDSVFQRDVDDPHTRGEEVAVDAAGDVHVRFGDLAPGKASGLRWEYPVHGVSG